MEIHSNHPRSQAEKISTDKMEIKEPLKGLAVSKETEASSNLDREVPFLLVYKIAPNFKTVSVSYELTTAQFLHTMA